MPLLAPLLLLYGDVAALLQWTPATHVTAAQCQQSYLPQHALTVTTTYGSIRVVLSLAGSSISKVTPDWDECQKAAAAAAAGPQSGSEGAVAAADVAAAAVDSLHRGLADGTLRLATHLMC